MKTEPARTTVHWPDPPAGEVWAIPGDPHFGAQDDRAHEVFAEAVEDAGATRLVCLGDGMDTWALSRHPKEANRQVAGGALEEEAEEAVRWLSRWADFAEVTWGPGNHEERWYDFARDNQAYRGTPWHHEWKRHLGKYVKTWLPRGFRLVVGRATLEHGHLLTGFRRGVPADPIATVLKHYPAQNTIHGHDHRVYFQVKTTWKNGEAQYHGTGSVGHLESIDSIEEYAPDAKMQQGGALVRWFSGGNFEFIPLLIHRTGKTGRGRVLQSPVTGREHRA